MQQCNAATASDPSLVSPSNVVGHKRHNLCISNQILRELDPYFWLLYGGRAEVRFCFWLHLVPFLVQEVNGFAENRAAPPWSTAAIAAALY